MHEKKYTINGVQVTLKWLETEAPDSWKIPGTPITALECWVKQPGERDERDGFWSGGAWHAKPQTPEVKTAVNQLIAARKGKKTNQR
jgi:hypothetical protein